VEDEEEDASLDSEGVGVEVEEDEKEDERERKRELLEVESFEWLRTLKKEDLEREDLDEEEKRRENKRDDVGLARCLSLSRCISGCVGEEKKVVGLLSFSSFSETATQQLRTKARAFSVFLCHETTQVVDPVVGDDDFHRFAQRWGHSFSFEDENTRFAALFRLSCYRRMMYMFVVVDILFWFALKCFGCGFSFSSCSLFRVVGSSHNTNNQVLNPHFFYNYFTLIIIFFYHAFYSYYTSKFCRCKSTKGHCARASAIYR
jgi:hypothetical protein